MAELYVVHTTVALVANTAKTVIELAMPATQTCRLKEIRASSRDSAGAQNSEVLWELCSYTATGTGTAQTPGRVNADAQGKAALITAKVNMTVEGTGGARIGDPLQLPAVGGAAVDPAVLGMEWYFPVSTFRGIRATAVVGTPTVALALKFEE